MNIRVTYSLPEELAERIKKASKKSDIPQSKIVARALEAELKKHEK